ncbi:hypothetical protein B0T16DRAFT_395989 [Cercophora newfieldiana]|uniref:Uncharacterized protein n=1 Tax=Cercophora newfieldiana TaxID=92897 RepID=A0AA39YNS1_9PEZI|nr:hypothetical protein B0T16DRAFT_395989 [Cercophora newfieldiana]
MKCIEIAQPDCPRGCGGRQPSAPTGLKLVLPCSPAAQLCGSSSGFEFGGPKTSRRTPRVHTPKEGNNPSLSRICAPTKPPCWPFIMTPFPCSGVQSACARGPMLAMPWKCRTFGLGTRGLRSHCVWLWTEEFAPYSRRFPNPLPHLSAVNGLSARRLPSRLFYRGQRAGCRTATEPGSRRELAPLQCGGHPRSGGFSPYPAPRPGTSSTTAPSFCVGITQRCAWPPGHTLQS